MAIVVFAWMVRLTLVGTGHHAISQFVSRCAFRQSFPGAIIHNGVLLVNAYCASVPTRGPSMNTCWQTRARRRLAIALRLGRLLAGIALTGLCATAQLVAAQQPRPYAMPGDEVSRFVTGFRAAIAANDLERVAGHVGFPLRVNTGAGRFHFVGRADFISEYFRIFSPKLRAAILKQDIDGLEQSAGDIAIGDGMVTVAGVCRDRQCATVTPKVTTVDLREP